MKTNREYRNVETGVIYDLHMNQTTHQYSLMSKDGINTVNGVYIAPNSNVTIKLNTGTVISLLWGEFYNLKKGEDVVSRKFEGEKRFRKC
jgi:hypothetical protein